jgi:CheY-like chemotaxis protein
MEPSQPHYQDLLEIHKAAEHSAALTRQLLAFARKQTIAPKVLDLNETVEGMLKMLRRLIGENIDLLWKPATKLWTIKMDPSQIDQVLVNLCVNARDAVSDFGKITIETENIALDAAYCSNHLGAVPGDYVLLSVSDNGCGMDKQTHDRIFEPFFTTKATGVGTGLGLATVYGIVKQNLGYINVYSEPGLGANFKTYLPRYYSQEQHPEVEALPQELPRGHETILLVEDQPELLDLNQTMLEMLGYRVLAAGKPSEALILAEKNVDKIHLLMTDVVMPEMNGLVLSQRLQSLYPGLKCLFMSGYTANIIAHNGVLDEGVCFIQKPFSINALAEKVRVALESNHGGVCYRDESEITE